MLKIDTCKLKKAFNDFVDSLEGVVSTCDAEPEKQTTKKETKPKSETADEKPATKRKSKKKKSAPAITLTKCKSIANRVAAEIDAGTLQDILADYEADKVGDIAKEDYSKFYKECEQELENAADDDEYEDDDE